jgi:hypothetical protein
MSKVIQNDTEQKLKLSQAKIKLAKKRLKAIQESGVTLRAMSAKLNHVITFQSLGRFINEKKYVPSSYEICKVLDLLADPNPYRSLPKWYKRTPEALRFFNTKRSQIKQMSNDAKATRESLGTNAKST